MSSLRRRHVAVLLAGYLAYTVGLVVAARSQPTGYEISVYSASPAAFWVGAAVALLAAMTVGLNAAATTLRSRLALLLGALVGISVAILPTIRDYYYYGAGDALSYLGWTRLIAEGQLNPAEFLYPGINSIAVVLTAVTGLPPRRTLPLVVPVFLAIYILFTALCVTRLAARSKAAAVGTFFALLFLPINNIHTYIFPYPTSAAIFFTPFALYLLIRYVGERDTLVSVRGYDVATPLGVLLTLAGIAAILIHPQSGSNVLLIIGAGFGLQLLARVYGAFWPAGRLTDHRSLAPQTALVGLFFALWIPRFNRATGTVSAVVNGLLYGANPGDEISTVGSSLSTLGSGIGELFVKIFLVSAVLSVVAGAVMLWAVAGGLDERYPDRNSLLRYVAFGFVPVFTLFGLFYVTSVTRQPFRYLGFIMVFVTVLVAVAVTDGIPFSLSLSSRNWQLAVGVALVVMLVPQAMVIHQSPYMYKDSDHVPETYMEGHVTSFEQRDPEVYFAGPRGGPRRYVDAYYGTTTTDFTPGGKEFPGKEAMIPFSVFGNNTTQYYSRCRYVPLTSSDYQREIGLYEGFRYSADAFRSFRQNPNVNRVQTNGDYRLYYVRGSDCGR
ncbi:hypothetical protein NDI56_03680 [Haloarcula sp. S1CR25-12]|uniref:Glycosyltransferase RgtA/B/C/D-like domain-containing protein n=1 Tax=Haloarcula saliterrae TaxID=2950534 RepID=A0ABU2F8B4_9EURY|nr:hypothetical protein [Haloarcula sp. S1CR25-12]MDS0258510.1 hypothetical protein [Haloarcula sp. S1CR25-12]